MPGALRVWIQRAAPSDGSCQCRFEAVADDVPLSRPGGRCQLALGPRGQCPGVRRIGKVTRNRIGDGDAVAERIVISAGHTYRDPGVDQREATVMDLIGEMAAWLRAGSGRFLSAFEFRRSSAFRRAHGAVRTPDGDGQRIVRFLVVWPSARCGFLGPTTLPAPGGSAPDHALSKKVPVFRATGEIDDRPSEYRMDSLRCWWPCVRDREE